METVQEELPRWPKITKEDIDKAIVHHMQKFPGETHYTFICDELLIDEDVRQYAKDRNCEVVYV